MKTTWALATILALAGTSLAEAERPRIYYPRHVKRQFGNSTTIITSSESLSPETTPSTTEFKTTTTKRDSLSDLISEILDGDDDETTTSASSDATSATDSGILVGPTGIVTTSSDKPKTTSVSKPGLLDPILSDLLPDTTTSSEKTTEKTTATTDDKTTKTTATADPETTSKPGLLDPIITALLPDPETSNTTTVPTSTDAESTASDPTTTSDGGILPTLSLPSLTLLPPDTTTSSAETSAPTTSGPVETSTSAPTDSVSITLPTLFPTSASTDSISISIPTSIPTSDLSEIPTNTTSVDEPPPLTPTSISTFPTSEPLTTDVPVTNITTPGDFSTTAPTDLPTTTSDDTTVSTTANTDTTKGTATSEPADVTTAPTTTESSVPALTPNPVTSLVATETYSNTGDWLPTTFVLEPTTNSWSPPTGLPTATNTKGLPTNIPKVILPDDPDKAAPEGTVLIQLGFKYPLNFLWVSKNTVAAAQIFEFMPQGLSDAGGFDISKIQITKLVPMDTQDNWGYITTLVKLYYPENMIDKLKQQLWTPNSAFYNNERDIVSTLMNNVNPKIDLFGDNESGGSTTDTPSSDSGSGGDNNDAFGNSNDSGKTSSKQMATAAGIAVGAVGLSVVYGAAMFIVARRYKRKRQAGHARASSVGSSQGSSEMQYNGTGSPALMGGALLSRDMSGYGGVAGGRESHGSGRSGASNSARTANISAPVAAENSLGWN